jgi:putative DNA primase/helicase
MMISKSGCDLNEPLGYQKVVETLRAFPKAPDVVVVDTLHRFLSGDENSAQDAKTMLDACAAIMLEFGCTVILVHHTGVSDEAQHRARGSSAWRGALDIEISVKPGDTIEVSQKKSKDAEMVEPAYIELQSVEIPGWLDEDGEPVTSAVVVEGVEVVKPKKDSKLDTAVQIFQNSWWHGGTEIFEDSPFVSQETMVEYLISTGVKEGTAKQ